MVEIVWPWKRGSHLRDMKIARKISPMIRMGVNMNPETQGKPQGNPPGKPQGKPQGNPIIRTKPEKIIAQTNKAKMMPNTGDPPLKGP
jgi:hypothetical protein